MEWMPKRMRRWTWVLSLALCLSACGCGRERIPAAAGDVLDGMLSAMRESGQTVPNGVIYRRDVPPEEAVYLGDTLVTALFGAAIRELLVATEGAAPINDMAVFLSVSPHPCELAVLRCSDARGTASAAGVLRSRLDLVRRAWEGTELAAMTDRAAVAVEGSYVLLAVADDPARALEGARRAIRRGGGPTVP